MELKRRQFLREKEAAQLLQEFSEKIRVDVRTLFDVKKLSVEVAEGANMCIYYLDGRPLVAKLKDKLVPTLLFEKAVLRLPKIVVNMGAVPHICNGADVLAPGVVKIDGVFGVGDYLLIVDERHGKPLAVVSALVDSAAASSLSRGKMATNLHYVGDDLWNALKKA